MLTSPPSLRCYYCPATEPTPDNPVPPPATGDTRYTLPSNCSTPFFNPQTNQCLCTSSDCAFTDTTKSIGNYSTNLGGDGASASGSATQRASAAERTAPVKQNGAGKVGASVATMLVGAGAIVLSI